MLTKNALYTQIIGLVLFLTADGFCKEVPDPMFSKLSIYETPLPDPGQRGRQINHNLGPTGARGSFHGRLGHTKNSREILIRSVEKGSPADGVLRPYDIIVGVNGKRFDSDARVAFGKAISPAELTGKLNLLRWREGEVRSISIPMRRLGSYAPTMPVNCEKSKIIAGEAAEFLHKWGYNGYSHVDGSLHTLFLLSLRDPKYMDIVRRNVGRVPMPGDKSAPSKAAWSWGYTALMLAEYYLTTGDETVLPKLEKYCTRIAQGSGKPGSWNHQIGPPIEKCVGGYGAMNQAGVICFMALALANESGVKVDQKVLRGSAGFFGGYAGSGCIPYGDHPPGIDATSNGKNGSAGVAFHILGSKRAWRYFAHLSASTDEIESGHSGNYFNVIWTSIAASLTGFENYTEYMRRFQWYFDLARRWDGSFVTQPQQDRREGDLGWNNYVNRGPMWTTGGYAMAYTAHRKNLRIHGAPRSVFAANPPKILVPALKLYRENDYVGCRRAFEKLVDVELTDAEKRMGGQLDDAAVLQLASIEHTLALAETLVGRKDIYHADRMLAGLEPILPKTETRCVTLQKRIKAYPNSEAILKAGAYCYDRMAGPHSVGKEHITFRASQTHDRLLRELQHSATRPENGPYRKMAQDYLATYPTIHDTWTTIIPLAGKAKRSPWRYKAAGANGSLAWTEADYCDSSWQQTAAAVSGGAKAKEGVATNACTIRLSFTVKDPAQLKDLHLEPKMSGEAEIYLNGRLILRPNCSDRIWLKPNTWKLLKPGRNTIAVKVRSAKDRHGKPTNWSFDMGLYAKRTNEKAQ